MKVDVDIITQYNKDALEYDRKWVAYLRDSLARANSEAISWFRTNLSTTGPSITVLDVGCGTGECIYQILQMLESEPAILVERIQFLGLEPAVEMLQIAK